jgi:hypothetical protein
MPIGLLGYLLMNATAFSVPVLLIVLLGRQWIPMTLGRGLVACSFAAGTGYAIYHVQWYDVWRHGVPPASDLLIYVAYMTVFGALGWVIGGGLYRRPS